MRMGHWSGSLTALLGTFINKEAGKQRKTDPGGIWLDIGRLREKGLVALVRSSITGSHSQGEDSLAQCRRNANDKS